jgi:histidinol-phosphate/aromatic aminotransferase/cobyric acid decarboxylase-like protein
MNRFWNALVPELTPYSPGEQPRVADFVKLNTNENPIGPSPRALEAIRAARLWRPIMAWRRIRSWSATVRTKCSPSFSPRC